MTAMSSRLCSRNLFANRVLVLGASLVLGATTLQPSHADTIVLEADRDNTLFESPTGALSNGSGRYLFVGLPRSRGPRRALVHFDVEGCVPFGSTVNSVSLSLNVSRTVVGVETIDVHRVLADWGEGSSDAGGAEGRGIASQSGDATWIHTMFSSSNWATAGGDFDLTASASQSVAAAGPYSWSGAGLVTDVQGWLDNPGTNSGWILTGRESGTRSAKRFDSRESPTAAVRPTLTIDFTPNCAPGTVNAALGPVADVFFINGSAGTGPDNCVEIETNSPIEYNLVACPAGPAIFEYVLWVWLVDTSNPTPLKVTSTNSLLGCTVNPTPLDIGLSPQPRFCIRSVGTNPIDCRGSRERPSPSQGPWMLTRGGGFPNPRTFQLQGLIEDNGALSPLGFSISNLITMKIVAPR